MYINVFRFDKDICNVKGNVLIFLIVNNVNIMAVDQIQPEMVFNCCYNSMYLMYFDLNLFYFPS